MSRGRSCRDHSIKSAIGIQSHQKPVSTYFAPIVLIHQNTRRPSQDILSHGRCEVPFVDVVDVLVGLAVLHAPLTVLDSTIVATPRSAAAVVLERPVTGVGIAA